MRHCPPPFDRRPASASTYARWASSYAHPYLSFQRNSTLQHYEAIEIIALGAENCVCMFAIVNDRRSVGGVRHQFLYVEIFVIRRSCSPPRGEWGESLARIGH